MRRKTPLETILIERNYRLHSKNYDCGTQAKTKNTLNWEYVLLGKLDGSYSGYQYTVFLTHDRERIDWFTAERQPAWSWRLSGFVNGIHLFPDTGAWNDFVDEIKEIIRLAEERYKIDVSPSNKCMLLKFYREDGLDCSLRKMEERK